MKWNDQKTLAEAVGISPQFLNDILHRRKRCPAKRAKKMELECYRILGILVPDREWILNKESYNRIFQGAPVLDATVRG